MPQVRWQARSDGLYWIDVALGTRSLSLMIDLGLVDLNGRVGFSVEPAIYAQLKKAGQLKDFLQQSNRDASGKIFSSESGRLAAQLIDPITFLPVGPTVQLHVMRGAPAVPSRVGVVFFHRLKGCQVSWDLDNRIWSIDYP